jgi:hypothetical protein
MSRFAQVKVFSTLYGAIYTLCFYLQGLYPTSQWWAPFRYYPSIEQWSITRLPPETAGPAILWYSWLAEAFVFTLVLSLLVPRRLADKVPPGAVWAGPAVTVVAILVYERRWFF